MAGGSGVEVGQGMPVDLVAEDGVVLAQVGDEFVGELCSGGSAVAAGHCLCLSVGYAWYNGMFF